MVPNGLSFYFSSVEVTDKYNQTIGLGKYIEWKEWADINYPPVLNKHSESYGDH